MKITVDSGTVNFLPLKGRVWLKDMITKVIVLLHSSSATVTGQ